MSEIKVQAFFPVGKYGYHNSRIINNGDVFMIEEKLFSPKWMKRLQEEKKRSGRGHEPEVSEESL